MRRSLACLLILPLLLAACGGDANGPDGDGGTRITLTGGLLFSPADLSVDAGTTVRWVASGSTFHTITPQNLQQPGVWARATSSSSGTVLTHTFTLSGQTYSYFCEVHAGMTGVIRVR